MKILVAVDGSAYTKRMLAYIAAHEEWLGAQHEYTLLHVEPAVPQRAAVELGKEALKSYYEQSSEKVFKPVRAFFARQGLKARFEAKVGRAGEVIADTAAKGRFELVMLGSHGHGSLANLVMGSVATQVLARCETPALLIR